MDKFKYKFSVIIPIYNVEEYLEQTIESVLEQSIGFEENIQLILINDGSPDNSGKICQKYREMYPNNVVYINQKNQGVSVARNRGIECALGEFTTFLDSDDFWSKEAFKQVYDAYTENSDINIFSCKMRFFEARRGNHPLNYKYKEDKIVNILEDYNYPQLSSSSIFIKTDLVKKHTYDATIKFSEDNKFINEIIIEEEKMMMLKSPIYFYRKRFAGNSAIQSTIHQSDWYFITPQKVYKYLFELSKKKYGRVIEYFQYLVLYEFAWRITVDKNYEFTKEERKKYIDILNSLISEIDDEIILGHRQLDLSKKLFLLSIKHKKNMYKYLEYNEYYVKFNELEINKKRLGIIIIDQTIFRNNKMIVYGKLDQKFVSKKDLKIKLNGKNIDINYYELTNNYNEETYNGELLHDYIGINFEVDIDNNWDLIYTYNNSYLVPRYKKNAVFTENLVRSYHHIGKRTIVRKDYILHNHRRNIFKSFYYELRCDANLLKRKLYKALLARWVVKIGSIFKIRPLWFVSDRVNRADDNGEQFFKYLVTNHPKENAYFVLTKDSPDYERLSEIGKVIDPNSTKYKLLFHLADYVVSAHAEDYIINPLGKGGKYIKDQYHFKYIFLQHGITINDLSPWLNVNTKKMDMFVTSSLDEYNSLLKYKYYFGEDVVKLTGFPRFDTLIEKQQIYKPQNTILMSFTWRRNLSNVINQKTGERQYNEGFKDSEYFRMINDLINDPKLLNALKENNYKIRFIPHPNVLPQLKDFTLNDYVEIEKNNINYQKEFCSSKLLLTDYSSVFFDFAYLKKPVIYYQKDKEEFYKGQIYDKGYFEYERDGFGPVCDDKNEAVNAIIKAIVNDCELDEKYKNRIDKFYTFGDNNNCQRVYDEIKKLK